MYKSTEGARNADTASKRKMAIVNFVHLNAVKMQFEMKIRINAKISVQNIY